MPKRESATVLPVVPDMSAGVDIMARARREADNILAKARSILDEAKSVQTYIDTDIEDDRVRARRIGFDEGFRAGHAHGEEESRSGRHPRGKSQAIPILKEAALRLRFALDRFEADREKYLEDLRQIVRQLSVGIDGKPRNLPKALAEFLEADPPKAGIRPEDEIWLVNAAEDSEKLEPSIAHAGKSPEVKRGSNRSSKTSGRRKSAKRKGRAHL
ncbi:MAG: hypothetical protein O6952_08580 [Planctomycetota bacterium]|nr:hypothetical protein [Planctomycetota bacterium]